MKLKSILAITTVLSTVFAASFSEQRSIAATNSILSNSATRVSSAIVVRPTPSPTPKPNSYNYVMNDSDWRTDYTGFGSVTYDANGAVLSPKASTSAGETHAALIIARNTENVPVKDFKLTVKVATEKQLRLNSSANAWEVFWLMFNYNGVSSNKTSNYVTLKPNGMELGKAYSSLGQTFLYTSSNPKLTIGKVSTWVVTKVGQNLQVSIDGVLAFSYSGVSQPLFDEAGSIGLYTEDARVRIYSVSLERLDQPVPTATPRPTATPTPRPTATPAPTATPRPTATPTPVPTATPRPTAAPTATPKPTAAPTPVPTATPTPKPTAAPTATPVPTAAPTATPNPSVYQYSMGAADWSTVYSGFGFVTYDATNGIVLSPKASTSANETHAALVLAKNTQSNPVKDFKMTVVVATEQQLRTNNPPNSWETFWLMFNYVPTSTGKNSNYVTVKPNGIEVGTAFDSLGQNFLYTGSTPKLTMGKIDTWQIIKQGQVLTMYMNGVLAFTYNGAGKANQLYDVAGSIGLYTEDARVRIYSASLERLDQVTATPIPTPAPTATPRPTAVPTPVPTAVPTAAPTATPSAGVYNYKMNAVDWSTVYSGFGSVTFDSNGVLLNPKASTSSGETHAALVLAKNTQSNPVKDFKMTVVVATEQQLRVNNPANSWEVFWLFFNYRPTSTGKDCNYVTVKPSGVEVGTAFDELGQKFLYTSSTPRLTVGSIDTWQVIKQGQVLTMYVNGTLAFTYNAAGKANQFYDVAGSVGLYTEDARVRIYSASLERL